MRERTKGGLSWRGKGRGGRDNTREQAQARAGVEESEDGGRLARVWSEERGMCGGAWSARCAGLRQI